MLRRLGTFTAHLEQRVTERTVQLEAAVVDLQVQIDHRQQVEHALAESETSFHHLFTGLPVPAWVYDRQTLRFLEVNDTAITQYGYSREEFLAMAITDIRPAEDISRVIAVAHTVEIRPERAGVWRHQYKDGRLVDVEISAHQLDFDGHRAIMGLIQDVTERRLAEAEHARHARHAALRADVGTAFTRRDATGLSAPLQRCAEAATLHLDAVRAGIWTLSGQESMLVLQASADLLTDRDGVHSRVPVAALMIGRIAQERRPYMTNDVAGDPRIRESDDHDWAQREGLRSFADYPLLAGGEVVGVLAAPRAQSLPKNTLDALGAVADMIATASRSAGGGGHPAGERRPRPNAARSCSSPGRAVSCCTPRNASWLAVREIHDLGPKGNEGVGQILQPWTTILASSIDADPPMLTTTSAYPSPCPCPGRRGPRYRGGGRPAIPLLRPAIQIVDEGASDAPPQRSTVLADHQRLTRPLILVDNAITYGREGGQVTLASTEQEGGRLRLLVRDTGPGCVPRS